MRATVDNSQDREPITNGAIVALLGLLTIQARLSAQCRLINNPPAVMETRITDRINLAPSLSRHPCAVRWLILPIAVMHVLICHFWKIVKSKNDIVVSKSRTNKSTEALVHVPSMIENLLEPILFE
jgi:hypothetical protein